MKRKTYRILSWLCIIACIAGLAACATTKKAPEKSGIQLIEGEWKLETSSDDSALIGSVIKVYPETGDGLITFLQNNSYCLRPNEIIWKDIIPGSDRRYTISCLANSCTSSLVYKEATLLLVSNDEIKLTETGSAKKALTQTWKRVIKSQILPK